MMATIVRMPEIAAGATEAAIAAWLIAVGDEVVAGQPIVEIETEKATVEYEAEETGTLAGTLFEPGATVEVGTPIAVLAGAGESTETALAEAGVGRQAATDGNADSASALERLPSPSAAHARHVHAPAPDADDSGRLRASPLVRRLAKEQGLELSAVRGTGPNGRIVRRDLEAFQSTSTTQPEPSTSRAVSPGTASSWPGAVDDATIGFTDVPHTGMRRAIARRLTESKSTVPHFYLAADCRVDALLALRRQVNELEGTRVSVNDFVVKAVAGALQDIPQANAIWTDDATRHFERVDISVAVSVPGGLLTPVVRDAGSLSLRQLSDTIRDLVERARGGRLKQHELEGGSFSVSNLGMYGTSEFAAIINPPQSAILAVGAAVRRPVVGDDDELRVATMMRVTLSADHRVLDGALGAEWLAAFVKRIEHPILILV